MRPDPEPYRLSFLVPDGADLDRAALGYRSAVCPATVHGAGLVVITGPSREALLDHAAEFLSIACFGLLPRVVALNLRTPAGSGEPGGRDSWTAVTGAQVAFFPGSRQPHVPKLARAPPAISGSNDNRVDERTGE